MKRLFGAVAVAAITIALSGCGAGSHRPPGALLKLIHAYGADSHVTGKTVEVYGPGSHSALEQAAMGDIVGQTAAEQSGCYVFVLHGDFEAGSSPSSGPTPHYTIETEVWTPDAGVTDTGVSNSLPATMSRLGRPTLVALKR